MLLWEVIEGNKKKSLWLFWAMGLCLGALGYLIGEVYSHGAGWVGLFIAFCVWVVLTLVSYFAGDSIILAMSGAKEVTHDIHPQLFNIVEEMKIAANLPKTPKIYIIPESAPNAFAVGRSPDKSAIAVTAGLVAELNRDELQGVIAHETSHILNRDVLFLTFAGIMLGSIVLLSEGFLRSLWYGGGSRRYRSKSSGGGQGQMFIMLIAVIFAVLAPVLARIFYFAISRKREYLADATAVRLTRYPEGLASALEKIAYSNVPMQSVNKITAPMYISAPFKKDKAEFSALSSTHPPVEERIKILRSIAGGANYGDYNRAFVKVKGSPSSIFPVSALRDSEKIEIRKPSAGKEEKSKKTKIREIGDLLRVVNGFAFLTCICGLRIKLPANYTKEEIECPRCHRHLHNPLAELAAAGVIASGIGKAEIIPSKEGEDAGSQQDYQRRSSGWESFNCRCGHIIQLSPAFGGKYVICRNCGRKIEILPLERG